MRGHGIVIVLVLAGSGAFAESKYKKLLDTILNDEAYKVRMQAIRVLAKQVEQKGERPDAETIDTLSRSATSDEEHLVRGMACFALGKLEDVRGEAALARATKDGDPFVRAQAEEALKRVRDKNAPPPSSGPVALIIGTDVVPGVSAPGEVVDALSTLLDGGFRARSGGRYAVGDKGGRGYHMKGSIAEMTVAPGSTGGKRVTIVVKIAIATWPDNNLRHVMSAKASAEAKVSDGPGLVRLQKKLLEAAVSKAIQDSMAQIGGG
jgi:hypothetical protein